MFNRLTSPLFAFALSIGTMAHAETVLLMAEEPGCIFCRQWNQEIGPIYEKTGEGAAAPLRRSPYPFLMTALMMPTSTR